MKYKKLIFASFLILGLGIFIYFLSKLGKSAVELITQNFNFYYLFIFIGITLLSCFPLVWRWQVILKAYGIKVPFIKLLKYSIVGYSFSFSTPFMRLGGEPLKAIMLKQECGVDYKTGSSSLVMDKFVEFLGTILFGTVCVILLFFLPINFYFKLILFVLILFASFLLFYFYYRIKKSKGVFSSLFCFFRLNKIKDWNKFVDILKEIEKKINYFFINHKKAFWLSFFFYCMSGTFFILEFKYALLIFGVDASITEIILAITMLGIANLTPVPGGLGVLEGLQSGLFHVIKGEGSIGMALVLLLRVRALLFVVLGYLLALHFGFLKFFKDYKNKKCQKTK